jgi:hypothetical protein
MELAFSSALEQGREEAARKCILIWMYESLSKPMEWKGHLFDRSFVPYSGRGRLRVGDCHEVIEFWQSIPVPRRSMGSFSLPQIDLGRPGLDGELMQQFIFRRNVFRKPIRVLVAILVADSQELNHLVFLDAVCVESLGPSDLSRTRFCFAKTQRVPRVFFPNFN